ncbi:MAG: hypothetical protein WBQ94_03715 [Terracidiphilus sp.]
MSKRYCAALLLFAALNASGQTGPITSSADPANGASANPAISEDYCKLVPQKQDGNFITPEHYEWNHSWYYDWNPDQGWHADSDSCTAAWKKWHESLHREGRGSRTPPGEIIVRPNLIIEQEPIVATVRHLRICGHEAKGDDCVDKGDVEQVIQEWMRQGGIDIGIQIRSNP